MTLIDATTPTGKSRGLSITRETVLGRIHLEVLASTKKEAEVNLTEHEAMKLYLALSELLAADEPADLAEGTRVRRVDTALTGVVVGPHPDPEYTRVLFDGYHNTLPIRTDFLQVLSRDGER